MYIIKNVKELCSRNSGTLKGFLHLLVVRFSQIILGLITTYFLAHTLTIYQYGVYQFVLNVLGVLTIFSLTEFSNTTMQSVARGFWGSFKKILPITVAGSLIGSFILLFFTLWYGLKEYNEALMICFFSAIFLFPFMYAFTIWRGYRIGQENFFSYTKIETLSLIFTYVAMLLVIHFFQGQYIGPFLCFIIIPSVINVLMTIRIWRQIPVNSPVENGVIRHGIHSSIYAAIPTSSVYIDKLLLFFFLSPSALALFAASDRLAELLRAAIQDAATALAPRFAKTNSYSDRLDTILKMSSLVFGILLMIFAFTILPFIITFIYGSQYESAIPYAQALVFSVAIGNLASLQFRYIRSKLDTKNFRNIMIYTSLARIIMSLVLIPLLGISGAVISSILYRIILTSTTNYVIKKDYRLITAE
jgi:O-antigen/teichoic acid export membrane protein